MALLTATAIASFCCLMIWMADSALAKAPAVAVATAVEIDVADAADEPCPAEQGNKY